MFTFSDFEIGVWRNFEVQEMGGHLPERTLCGNKRLTTSAITLGIFGTILPDPFEGVQSI